MNVERDKSSITLRGLDRSLHVSRWQRNISNRIKRKRDTRFLNPRFIRALVIVGSRAEKRASGQGTPGALPYMARVPFNEDLLLLVLPQSDSGA